MMQRLWFRLRYWMICATFVVALSSAFGWLVTVPLLSNKPYWARYNGDYWLLTVRRGVLDIDRIAGRSSRGWKIGRDELPQWLSTSQRFGLMLPESADGWFVELSIPLCLSTLTSSVMVVVACLVGVVQKPSSPCTRCNYDLTGNMSGVCPECGHSGPEVRSESHRTAIEQVRGEI